ncbi:MD-2-related lipid-recognition domain-containing protein [Mucidula mucida]|nr:MD-2-related lipid-recognition domain-containing protein [Mucidula mucida]
MRPSILYTFVFSSLAYLANGANDASFKWNNCGNAHNAVQVKSVQIVPDPPLPGQEWTVEVVVDILKPVEEGATGALTLELGGLTVLDQPFDICEEATNCPIKPGKYTVKRTVTLPLGFLVGMYVINVVGHKRDGGDLMCLDVSGEINVPGL